MTKGRWAIILYVSSFIGFIVSVVGMMMPIMPHIAVYILLGLSVLGLLVATLLEIGVIWTIIGFIASIFFN